MPNSICYKPAAWAGEYTFAREIEPLARLAIERSFRAGGDRDRLSKAFLFDPKDRDQHHDLQLDETELYEIDTNLCPYPIINAPLNIEGSHYASKRGRNADLFVFRPEYVGSGATGYIGTQQITKTEPALDLGTRWLFWQPRSLRT